MTHLEVQHKADIFKRQIIQRSAAISSYTPSVLEGFPIPPSISTPWPSSRFPLWDRFASELEFPSSKILPDSLSTFRAFLLFFTPLLQLVLTHFSSLNDQNSFIFCLLPSCFSVTVFTVLLFFFLFRRQNLIPEAQRSSISKLDARLGVYMWSGMHTRERGRKTKGEDWLWERILFLQ